VIAASGDATLFLAPRRDHNTAAYFSDARYGELWVGPRRGLDEAGHHFGISTASLEDLPKVLADLTGPVAVVRTFDASIDAQIAEQSDLDHQLVETLHGMRLIKDDFELAQLQLAVDYTVQAFGDVARALPIAVQRGERVIEGVFNLRARVEGNNVGYSTIAASGAHATILHWTKNDGVVREGDLLLLDAGVECANLYTADVTRTFPINGTFSPAQRRIYELVYEAQEAAIATVKPGVSFLTPHQTAMEVLAKGLYELGILNEEPEIALQRHRQSYRRWTLHGVSHWLGIDVHDCAQARNEVYTEPLVAGQVLTVEPGLYFQANDLSVPEEYRGIGVRIEDDIVVTETGFRNLSAGLPRTVDGIEAWIAAEQAKGVPALGL
jgi:Xaa-Pro aminopeptidase